VWFYSQLSPLAFVIMILLGSITSCSLSGKADGTGNGVAELGGQIEDHRTVEKAEAPAMRVVGEIVSVHPGEQFVLVKRFLQTEVFGKSDLIASVSPEGRTSSLALTGEKLGRFYAADIQDGQPAKGDLVVVRRTDERDPPAESPVERALIDQAGE